MGMNREKFIDESWKESAAQEKERLESVTQKAKSASVGASSKETGPRTAEGSELQPASRETSSAASEQDFIQYISSLAYQAMIFLGEISNPVTNQLQRNLEQAKFIIDTLILLQQKTNGNLTEKESDMLNTAAYELQVKYVEIAKKESTNG